MKSKLRKISCMCLTAVMASTFIAGNALAFANNSPKSGGVSAKYDTVSFENLTGKVDLTGIALQNMNTPSLSDNASGISVSANETYTVIATLKQDSVIDSKDASQTVSEYLATFSGGRTLDVIYKSQQTFLNELKKAGIKYTYVSSFDTITNSVAIKVKGSEVSKVRKLASVQSLVFSSTYARPEEADTSQELATAVTNPNDVYPTGIYDSASYVAEGLDGSGVTIAVLDTGLDYTHDAFNVMPEKVAFTEDYVAQKVQSGVLRAQQYSSITVNDVYINAKVPFAYDYADKDADVYPAYSQHGVHVAGISAGDSEYGYVDKDGKASEENFQGVAPKAQLVICKVFTDDFDSKDLGGAVTEDILAALEDCVSLGVDVINMSLGTSSGFSSVAIEGDTEGELINGVYSKIKNEGINLICAASNDFSSGYGSAFGTNLSSNPDSGTVGSPSTFEGALSVASINGQKARYFTVDASSAVSGKYSSAEAVYYTESSDANYQKNDFLYGLIGVEGQKGTYKAGTHKFKYVVVNGTGQASDYSTAILNQLNVKSNEYPNGLKGEGEKVIAVIKRGTNTFQQKVEIAMRMGADAVIIYNNVAGSISMSLGDIDDPVPAVSVTMDAGAILTSIPRTGSVQVGEITVGDEYQAGPFMNDYSSWGATPDLKLKPEITSYGGDITSAVAGGYAEMSGTSMATPNLAGFTALLRSYFKAQYTDYSVTELTKLINNVMMSTATTVYTEEGLPYSPRKQGAGLATLENVFNTKAYLNTDEDKTEDGRPKIELGDGTEGVYNLKFYVNNFNGSQPITFSARSVFMTETLSSDGLSVAEKAHLLTDEKAVWKLDGAALEEGEEFTVAVNSKRTLEVTLKLSKAEIKYINDSFENGMYIEGFLTLDSHTEGQCNLNLPFMGFYGDWKSAPMLDYDCYEIAEFEKDSSYTDETRPQAQVWATQAYANYYGNKYVIPMGNYVYLQDEDAEQIYTNIEYSAVSRFNDLGDEEGKGSYATSYEIKALYAGLLRNAELVTYDMYNTDTGEKVISDRVYRVPKASAGGGSAVPAQVLLDLDPVELGLIENGRYSMEFHFYMDADDTENSEENTFNMIFYVDYEAPVLQSSSIRYYDYKEDNINKQRVYLDLEIYDNHYAQAVMLCYPKDGSLDEIILATKYITPVYNPVKNGTSKVTIEITDLIETEQNFYVQVVDYALNYQVYGLNISSSRQTPLPDTFSIVEDDNLKLVNGEYVLTLGVNEAYTVKLDCEGSASLSNFEWYSANPNTAKVQSGEIFGVRAGYNTTITVTGKNNVNQKIRVNVVESKTTLKSPKISFGTIKNADGGLQKASGTVEVNAGSEFKLSVIFEPWYYPTAGLTFTWSSSNTNIATVDTSGNVRVLDSKGSATIIAEVYNANGSLMASTPVRLSVKEPYTVTGSTLTAYHGSGGDLVFPTDKNIMTIAEDAFKDNDTITSIVLPSTVTTISARAFARCTALKSVTIAGKPNSAVGTADLSLISANAFAGCTALKTVDLSNCKVITVDRGAFSGCTSLTEVKHMEKIGTMNAGVFAGCTSLLSADITGLHMSGVGVFAGCTSLAGVTTAFYTDIGANMFEGCTSLKSIEINTPTVKSYAFAGCTSLESVTFGKVGAGLTFTIGAFAFDGCTELKTVEFNGNAVSSIGDRAFANCGKLATFNFGFENGSTVLGDQIFYKSLYKFNSAVYSGTTLVAAPATITSSFEIKSGTTEIAPYAFSSSTLEAGVTSIVIPATVTKIGEGAFAHLGITSIIIPDGVSCIPANAFYETGLASISIPANVASIGEGAFYGCTALKRVEFATASKLESIANFAFMNCDALEGITLPDSCADMGSRVFGGCSALVTVTLPSVTNLGLQTFIYCDNLQTVTFGANASTTGIETFAGCEKLSNVTLGNNTLSIGFGAFNSCEALERIDLKNAVYLGGYAFTLCTALSTVTGLNLVKEFGEQAFAGCTSLENLRLDSAEIIGDSAFYDTGFTALYIPEATSIGAFAFYGGNTSSVTLPSTLAYLGDGAFGASSRLREILVDIKNEAYFSSDGVVYRNVGNAFELSAYPAYKSGSEYEILSGTVQIQGYAFAEMKGLGFLKKVTIPYSVKAIGIGAFYSSGITTYEFNCVEAPVLYSEYYENGSNSLHAFNFEDEFFLHTKNLGLVPSYPDNEPAQLTIIYPENGTGFDNLIYANYFSTARISAEIMDNTTRALKTAIEGFHTAQEVSAWSALAVNDENKAMVQAFADKVKSAHATYNNIKSATQLEFLGGGNVEKLLAIESALKPVKSRFGIPVTVEALEVNANSGHKTAYKVGDTFDMTGLTVDITYDDYSTETIDASSGRIVLSTTEALTTLNRYVRVYVDGRLLQVAISVTEKDDPGPGPGPGPDPDNKFNPAVIYGPIIGVVVFAGIAATVVLLLKKKKSAKSDGKTLGNADENKED